MEFKKCQIANVVYGDATDFDIQNSVPENEGMRESSVNTIQDALRTYFKGSQDRANKRNDSHPNSGEALYNMFRLLGVCHTVVVEKDEKTGKVIY
jgi:magnesium-transporting ATPase (P-type)